VGGPGRLLMNDPVTDRAAAVKQIAAIFAGAFLRLRFPDPHIPVDCAEATSESCESRLTL
jgi:hypothetical protein